MLISRSALTLVLQGLAAVPRRPRVLFEQLGEFYLESPYYVEYNLAHGGLPGRSAHAIGSLKKPMLCLR